MQKSQVIVLVQNVTKMRGDGSASNEEFSRNRADGLYIEWERFIVSCGWWRRVREKEEGL